MRKGIRSEFNNLIYNKTRLIIAGFILIILIIGSFYYFYYNAINECDGIDCYKIALSKCDKVFVMNEDESYIWRYEILGEQNSGTCNVNVRLLRIKQGDIDLEDLQNFQMTCQIPKQDELLPDKDLLRCSGRLKEEFQEIIINRLHNYLLLNIDSINVELNKTG